MEEDELTKLVHNIQREDNYEPLVVRPDPQEEGAYQVINGHQRWKVLERLGHTNALCYLWPCDDATALTLLATLNRLQGTDEPLKRAELLRDLAALMPLEELAALVPEDAATIGQHLELLGADLETLLASFARPGSADEPLHAVTFVVTAEDEAAIEQAVAQVAQSLEGKNRRGRALAEIARSYLAAAQGPQL